ncbi:MAG: TerB family tellurite resistance protein [Flavobacteriia bacterium]|nr:TerB family tellurite resistance protein [Flavobacteriia bacterium]
MSEENNKNKLGILTELIKLAKADNDIRDIEFNFLLALASQMGVSKDEFIKLFEQYIEFLPPKLEFDRIVQFHRLVLVMNVDSNTTDAELDYIKQAGIRMGLNPLATNEILRILDKYPNKVVPTDVLMNVFRSFHN